MSDLETGASLLCPGPVTLVGLWGTVISSPSAGWLPCALTEHVFSPAHLWQLLKVQEELPA